MRAGNLHRLPRFIQLKVEIIETQLFLRKFWLTDPRLEQGNAFIRQSSIDLWTTVTAIGIESVQIGALSQVR